MKVVLIIVFVAFIAMITIGYWPQDKLKLTGKIININGMYYRMECRTGNSYVLEPVDTSIIFIP